jgi:hypothetical protein|tara:strand:- start:5608 stop:5988 length:381 start_codon:yes stop_codon:yes gene_type:complete
MGSPIFDFINDASHGKKNLIEQGDYSEKDYNPYITNTFFSFWPETVLHANIMNEYHFLDNEMQYVFFINSVKSKKRFKKWLKNKNNNDLDNICRVYGCNRLKAEQYANILSSKQLKQIDKECNSYN